MDDEQKLAVSVARDISELSRSAAKAVSSLSASANHCVSLHDILVACSAQPGDGAIALAMVYHFRLIALTPGDTVRDLTSPCGGLDLDKRDGASKALADLVANEKTVKAAFGPLWAEVIRCARALAAKSDWDVVQCGGGWFRPAELSVEDFAKLDPDPGGIMGRSAKAGGRRELTVIQSAIALSIIEGQSRAVRSAEVDSELRFMSK